MAILHPIIYLSTGHAPVQGYTLTLDRRNARVVALSYPEGQTRNNSVRTGASYKITSYTKTRS